MIETLYQLDVSRSVTIGSNGEATVIGVGPTQQGERWVVTNTSVNTTSPCTFQSFRGLTTADANQIDVTHRGSASSDTRIELRAGEVLSFKWSLGVAGSTGTVHLEGERYVRGRRAY